MELHIPDEALSDVMWEIAEHNERHDLISATELKRRVGGIRRLGAFAGRSDDVILAQRALLEVLREIDNVVAGR